MFMEAKVILNKAFLLDIHGLVQPTGMSYMSMNRGSTGELEMVVEKSARPDTRECVCVCIYVTGLINAKLNNKIKIVVEEHHSNVCVFVC